MTMIRHRRKKNRKSPSPWDRVPPRPLEFSGSSPLSQTMVLS
jgi:hypothetical protein